MKIMEYEDLVEGFFMDLADTADEAAEWKPEGDKWSLKEIVGHLVDSASNNIQRFVRLQLADHLEFPAYDAESWIRVQVYSEYNWQELISLWYSLNLHLLHVVRTVQPACLKHVWKKPDGEISLEDLIVDYFSHLDWHINHFHERLGEAPSAE